MPRPARASQHRSESHRDFARRRAEEELAAAASARFEAIAELHRQTASVYAKLAARLGS